MNIYSELLRIFLVWATGLFSHWSRTLFVGGGLFSSRTFFDQSRTFLARGGLFSIGVGLFLVGGGLFLSPTVAEKSPTPAEKSPTAILKRCWTLEYFGELEFSSPFMEQWTLDARGVLLFRSQTSTKVRLSH